MNNTFSIAQGILERTERDGGCTYLFHSGTFNPSHGFVVGNVRQSVQLDDLPEAAYIAHLIEQFKKLGANGLGTWKHGGVYYVDPILHIEREIEARLQGNLTGEIAIWDCKRGVEMILNTGVPVC